MIIIGRPGRKDRTRASTHARSLISATPYLVLNRGLSCKLTGFARAA